MNYVDPKLQARRTQIVEVLEMVCKSLELSASQFALAKQRYEGVGACLAGSDDPVLRAIADLSPGLDRAADDRQADRRQRTRRRPGRPCARPRRRDLAGGAEEGDRRLPARERQLRAAPGGDAALLAAELRERIPHGHHAVDPEPELPVRRRARSRQDAQDVEGLEPEGLQAAVRGARQARPGHPAPQACRRSTARRRASSPIPDAGGFKGILRRTVQIAKRHRDIVFVDEPDVAPLSVIITTLASRSYEWCVTNREYDNELDLLFDVIRHMPDTIEIRHVEGRAQWFIWNETTAGENFAEKWNRRPERAEAFYAWHARFCSDLAQLEAVSGLDRLGDVLKGLFGSRPANAAIDSLTERVSTARRAGNLRVAPAVGLSVGAMPASTSVPANTFFGSNR